MEWVCHTFFYVHLYPLVKFLHMLGLITWLGLGAGGVWLLVRAEQSFVTEVRRWGIDAYPRLDRFSQAGFLLMLLTGIALSVLSAGVWKSPWFHGKLTIVALLLIVECAQFYSVQLGWRRVPPPDTDAEDRRSKRLSALKTGYKIVRLRVGAWILLLPILFYLSYYKP